MRVSIFKDFFVDWDGVPRLASWLEAQPGPVSQPERAGPCVRQLVSANAVVPLTLLRLPDRSAGVLGLTAE